MLQPGRMSRVFLSMSQEMLIRHIRLDLLEVMVVLMTPSSKSSFNSHNMQFERVNANIHAAILSSGTSHTPCRRTLSVYLACCLSLNSSKDVDDYV